MSDDQRLVLPPAASRALVEFAERIGRDPQELAAEAIERFIAEEEPIAEAVLQAIKNIDEGKFFTHEEMLERFASRTEQMPRKRA